MSTTSTPGRKRDPLAGAKTDAAGQPVANPREQVVELVSAARAAYPNGLPTGSPFASAPQERLWEFANSLQLGSVVGLLQEDELRLVIQHAQAKQLAAAQPPHVHEGESMRGPMPRPQPATELQRAPVKGADPSPINEWRALEGRRCTLRGQMFWVERGAIIRARDYSTGDIQLLIDQGLQLHALHE